MERPKLKENPDFSKLINFVETVINHPNERAKNFEYYTWEYVMNALYDSKEFFKWYKQSPLNR